MSATTIAPPITTSTSALSELESLIRQIDRDRMPRHIAMICDGNGRWASQRGLPRPFGHRQGYMATRKIVRAASDLGLEALTLYAFSTENWTRPKTETDALMRLFEEGARRELRELHENGVRMRFSGRISELPESLQARLRENEELTRNNPGLTLNICLNYSGRDEILRAAKHLVEVTPDLFARQLDTADLPDPDLLIRTAGELRVSNYLLYQIAYAELWVTPTLWPDFDKLHLVQAILDYQKRVRKFGGVK
jgi:undecaprenyl diphosphate synthase